MFENVSIKFKVSSSIEILYICYSNDPSSFISFDSIICIKIIKFDDYKQVHLKIKLKLILISPSFESMKDINDVLKKNKNFNIFILLNLFFKILSKFHPSILNVPYFQNFEKSFFNFSI